MVTVNFRQPKIIKRLSVYRNQNQDRFPQIIVTRFGINSVVGPGILIMFSYTLIIHGNNLIHHFSSFFLVSISCCCRSFRPGHFPFVSEGLFRYLTTFLWRQYGLSLRPSINFLLAVDFFCDGLASVCPPRFVGRLGTASVDKVW